MAGLGARLWSSGAALKTDKQRVSVDHPVLQLLFKVFPTTTAKVGRITARIAPPPPVLARTDSRRRRGAVLWC